MTQTELTPTETLTGKWKPYSAYKDSGVEWLGEIPAHWEVKRLKYVAHNGFANGLFKKKDQFGSGTKLVNVADLYRNNFLIDFESIDRVKTEQQEYETFKVESGDIFFVRSSLKLDGVGASASIIEVPEPTVFECHLVRMHPSSKLIVSRYLINYLNSSLVRQRLVALAETTTMTTIAQPKLVSLEVIVPPTSVQHSIITFLDRETARINALIAKKERLIELLQEKRAALISHAVTKGLNPTVPMRDSGVEWLEEIPAHWAVLQLRRIVNTFVDYRGFTPVKTSDGIPLITARNIKNGVLDLSSSQEFISEEDYASRMVRGFPENGDVLITTEAPLGETAQIVDERVTLAQRIILLKVDKALITNEYLKFYFMSGSGKGELWSRATGSTAIGIKASHLREVFIIIPSLSEQQAIVSYLDREIAKIDALVSRTLEGIEKLKEYSSALISAAVTGKIDVRGEILSTNNADF
jgi:type I restriction enzyme, S subunit